jgi:hypothetical protein
MSLARRKSSAVKKLQGLLASQHLTATNNTTVLVLNQVRLGESTGRVLCGAMVNLGLGANSRNV